MKSCHYFKPRLALWAGGDLNPSEAADVQSHLAICPECGDRLQQLQQSRAALEHSDPEPTYLEQPRSLWPEVNRRITAALAVPHVPMYRKRWVWQTAAAFLVVLMTWLVWPRGPVGPGKPNPRSAALPVPVDVPPQSENLPQYHSQSQTDGF
jgi:anti-sigma factor RsiW